MKPSHRRLASHSGNRGPCSAIALLAAATIASGFLATPASAQAELSEVDALRLLVREALQKEHSPDERFQPAFEDADAASFIEPYEASLDVREKGARKSWYRAQLPSDMPRSGRIRISYLYQCHFPTYVLGAVDEGDISDEELAIADQVWIAMAFEKEGLEVPNLSDIKRSQNNVRDEPAPGLRFLNFRLSGQQDDGVERFVLEPYCGPVFPDESVPPPPPPPPPEPPPESRVYIEKTPGTSVFIASAYKAHLCRLRTGSAYNRRCSGWYEVLSNPIELGGNFYHFAILRNGRLLKSGEIDLEVNAGPLQLVAP